MANTQKKIIGQCLLCDSGDLRCMPGYEKDHLVSCEKCSFVFSNLRPSREELDKVYGAYSRDFERTPGTISKMEQTASFLKNLSGAKNVLDIGCGDGEFLKIFRNLGCAVFGSEYDSATEEVCRKKGIHMLGGGLMPSVVAPHESTQFDLAIFTEVIEHINNPLEVINHISGLLKNGGYLYITTPNFSSLERRVLKGQWGMIAYPEHISFYSPKTLDQILRKSGYEKVFLKTENISIFRIIQFLNEKRSGGAGKKLDPEGISAAAQGAIQGSYVLRLAKNIVNAIMDITGMGSSMIAVYKKAGH